MTEKPGSSTQAPARAHEERKDFSPRTIECGAELGWTKDVEISEHEGGIWLETETEGDGCSCWAHMTPTQARAIAVELVRLADQIDAKAKPTVPMPEYEAQPTGSGHMRMERIK